MRDDLSHFEGDTIRGWYSTPLNHCHRAGSATMHVLADQMYALELVDPSTLQSFTCGVWELYWSCWCATRPLEGCLVLHRVY